MGRRVGTTYVIGRVSQDFRKGHGYRRNLVATTRTTSRTRSEYRPASTPFFVWQQGRSGSDPSATDFRSQRDFPGVFDTHPMNTLLIKASFWFNP